MNPKLKTRLRVLRAEHEFTQEELAKKIGVSRQTVISIEKGDYAPSVALALALAKCFDTTVENIFSID